MRMLLAVLAAVTFAPPLSRAQDEREWPDAGILRRTPDASAGYTLVHPIYKGETFLINLEGEPIHNWTSNYAAASSAYLLDDGSLLRTTLLVPPSEDVQGRGAAGRVERLSWDGDLLWEFEVANDEYLSHHDIEPLPGGNVLMTIWDHRTREEALAAGRNPKTLDESGMLSETVIEVEPRGARGGRIVWRWNLWDHLIQDFDPQVENYGDPAEHSDRVDINIVGYNGGPEGDWLHMNSIDYNPQLDQIMLSTPVAHELWVIDHSTTTDEAGTDAGGRSKRGGGILYRWGNPQMWMGGASPPQRFFFQHDPHWVPQGLPGEGNILVFNNGIKDGPRNFSTVDELTPPVTRDGTYARHAGSAFAPRVLAWQYGRGDRSTWFFANRISGSQRLPSGNTLVCVGSLARIIEVTPEGRTVWDFFNGSNAALPIGSEIPYRSAIPPEQGGPLGGGGPMFRSHRYPPDHPALAVRIKDGRVSPDAD